MTVLTGKVLDALAELANQDYQVRVWSGEDDEEMSSFSECIETLYDDSGLEASLSSGPVYGDVVDERLRVLSCVIDEIDGNQPPDQLVMDPQLGLARRLAAEALDLLRSELHAAE